MATLNISLPEQMKAWVEIQATGGRYASASDYVRDLVRKDQERAVAIREIQILVDESLASGDAQAFDIDVFLADKRPGNRAKG
jgi:antitoxin ParD1/3/4